MVEGHQSLDTIHRLSLQRLLELAEGVQAMVNRKNAMIAASAAVGAP